MSSRLITALLLCSPVFCLAQNIVAPSVLSTTGDYDTAQGISLSYSVGEAVITTLQLPGGEFYLTQGFEQPSTAHALSFALNVNNESCLNSNDGSVFITITGGVSPYTIAWSSKPSYNGLTIDSLIPGQYTVTLKDGNGLSTNASFTIVASEAPCQIKIYNGITPNGDGHNDTWVIDNIDLFPNNSVSIYNRWGNEVWSGNGYDNTKVVWKGEDSQNQPLPDGTYFYLVSINGATPLKGWVQLTR